MSSLRGDTVKTFEGNISVAFPSGIWTRWKVHGTCHRVTFHGLFDTCHCVDCQITRGAEMITQQGIHLPTKVRR